jgi:hypothetical protein
MRTGALDAYRHYEADDHPDGWIQSWDENGFSSFEADDEDAGDVFQLYIEKIELVPEGLVQPPSPSPPESFRDEFSRRRAHTISRSIRLTGLMREARKTTVLKSGPSKRSSAEEVVRKNVEVAAAEQPCAAAAIHRMKKSGQTWAICTAEDGERMRRERSPGGSHHNRVAYARTLFEQVSNGLLSC